MALINVKKKIEKAGDKLGLMPGEVVHAACTTNPAGTMKKMLASQLGGAVGSALAGSHGGGEHAPGMADAFPSGQHFLVLTSHRMILTSVGAMSGKPKDIVAEWQRSDVTSIAVEAGRMAAPLQIAFSDGSAIEVEGAKGTDPGNLATAFGS